MHEVAEKVVTALAAIVLMVFSVALFVNALGRIV